MTFAGLSNPQDRADVMVYLNSRAARLTIPPPPAAAPAEGNAARRAMRAEGNAGAEAERRRLRPPNAAAPAAVAALKAVS